MAIKYHPSEKLLSLFATGELSVSYAIAISAHAESCPECAKKIDKYTETLAKFILPESKTLVDSSLPDEFKAMFQQIVSQPKNASSTVKATHIETVEINKQIFNLPRALRRFGTQRWVKFGHITRARIPLDDSPTRSTLLHIAKGGAIPSHTHKGEELILLLQGTFEDEYDTYHPGDFLLFDHNHHHSPTTKEGCLCLTISDAPLHFTKGISRLLNSLGNMIY